MICKCEIVQLLHVLVNFNVYANAIPMLIDISDEEDIVLDLRI